MSIWNQIVKGSKHVITPFFRRISLLFEGKPTETVSIAAAKNWKKISHIALNSFVSLVVAYILVAPGPYSIHLPTLREGQLVELDVVSPLSADIETRDSRSTSRDELAKKVAPVFDYDETAVENWLKNWQHTIRTLRQEFYPSGKPAKKMTSELLQRRIQDLIGKPIPNTLVSFLQSRQFSPTVETELSKTGEFLLGRLITSTDLFASYYNTGIVVRQLSHDLTETLIYDISRIWSMDQAREFIGHVPELLKRERILIHPKIASLLQLTMVPNLKLNSAQTEKRIQAIMGSTRPMLTTLKKGQLILRRGERVTEYHQKLIQAVNLLMSPASIIKRLLWTSAILLVLFSILFRMELTKRGFWFLSLKDSLVVMGLLILSMMSVKWGLPTLRMVMEPMHINRSIEYLLPLSAGGVILHLLMGKEVAYSFALLISLLCGFMLDRDFFFSIWVFMVSASNIQMIRSCKQRTDLYKAGIWSGGIGAIIVVCHGLILSAGFRHLVWQELFLAGVFSVFSGILSAIICGTLIPVMEALLGYTTSLKLLELSNFNHPLLHNLMLKAPGTYHHSVIVGSLAELAADRIKANGLLARVSAYYHDIGKMNKPLYFIENQPPNQNPHDALQPSMSAKILFSHVKVGTRMAREYKLGKKITDIIEQHHGTTLVSYFFNKAKKSENVAVEKIIDGDFRYPGPRPQSREAAIVMLADACEAATRSIQYPTPSKIQTMVQNIINRRFLEHQFSDCDLTLNDLKIIEECFTRTLVSLYHHRIEYPGQQQTGPSTTQTQAIPLPIPIEAKRATQAKE